ncbi:Hepatoma-derived growth factor-related protein 3 [Taenia solium]|eukprot:TsM_001185600 transcript=TsM_001185600 gene=TsM_001185600
MFQPGDRVFAKMKGFPFWPARVDPLPSHVELPKGKVPVFFYGTHQVSFLSPKNLVSFEDHKDAYGKRKVLIKAMIEIESDPEVLLLGKDPAAEAFWESLYPREYGKFEREGDNARGRMSRSNSPVTKRPLKRKASKAPRVHLSKRQRSSDQEDDLVSMSPISDTVDTALLQETEAMGEKEEIRQQNEEDYLQTSENASKRTGIKRHYLAVECDDLVANAKRVKEGDTDVHFGVEKAVLLMEEGDKSSADFEIDHLASSDEIVEVTCDEGSSNAVSNVVIHDIVNDDGGEFCNAREFVKGDAEGAQELTSSNKTEIGPIKRERCGDVEEIVPNPATVEYQKSHRDMRGGKLKRFVVDLDAESEDEERYFRRCSRSDDGEDLDVDNADDGEYYHGYVQKPKGTDKRSVHNAEKDKEKGTVCSTYGGMVNEFAAESRAVDVPRKRDSSSSERESISKSSRSTDGEEPYDCKLQNGDVLQNRVEEDEEHTCKNYGGMDNEAMDVAMHSNEQKTRGSSEGGTFSKSTGSDDFGESDAYNVKSGDVCHKRGIEEDRLCFRGGFVRGEVQTQHIDNKEYSEPVRENLYGGDSESLSTSKNIRSQRRPDSEGKDASVDKLQLLRDLTVQLKSNLVRGHEKFSAAVDVLERICATKVSLLQLTKVWELTDCVKKCRKYRLSAEVRDAASRVLAYFQRVQAAASKEEVLKAKAIVGERIRREKYEKPSPTSAAAAPVATSASNTGSPPVSSSPEQQQEKKKFSLEALRAELDAKADLLLARLAATEARLMAERNKTTSSPVAPSSSSAAVSAVSSSRRRTEETAKDVLSRVDEVASRLGVDSGAVPPPPPPPLPPRFARPQQVDLDTRISQLMMGVITPPSRPPPHPQPQSSSPSQSAASAKLLALREQIQRKRRSAATAAASTAGPRRETMEKTADDDIYDLLGV